MSKKSNQKDIINSIMDNMNYEEIREVITLIVLENNTARKELIKALKEYNSKLYTESLRYLELEEDSI